MKEQHPTKVVLSQGQFCRHRHLEGLRDFDGQEPRLSAVVSHVPVENVQENSSEKDAWDLAPQKNSSSRDWSSKCPAFGMSLSLEVHKELGRVRPYWR